MFFTRRMASLTQVARAAGMAALTLTLVSCATEYVDDTTGSHLTQPPPGSPPRMPVDANDIAIVGQEVAHSIMDLPVVANATVPPLVQFTGVTSIVVGPTPVDTEPYTELLRDRLLLITRLKLRFVEQTLPPLVVSAPKKKHKKETTPAGPTVSTTPDYVLLAELRGRYEDDLYRVQVQFVDAHTNEILFDGLYSIRKESSAEPIDNSAPGPEISAPPPPAPPADTGTSPTQ